MCNVNKIRTYVQCISIITSDIKSLTSNKENMKSKTAGTLKLRHFELCPANQMSEKQRESIPESVKIRNIGVAVAVLLGK